MEASIQLWTLQPVQDASMQVSPESVGQPRETFETPATVLNLIRKMVHESGATGMCPAVFCLHFARRTYAVQPDLNLFQKPMKLNTKTYETKHIPLPKNQSLAYHQPSNSSEEPFRVLQRAFSLFQTYGCDTGKSENKDLPVKSIWAANSGMLSLTVATHS